MVMPETPDFDQIAQRLARRVSGVMLPQAVAQLHVDIVRELRLVWNARGAADIAKLAAYLSRQDEGTLLDGAIVSVDAFDRALRTLDR